MYLTEALIMLASTLHCLHFADAVQRMGCRPAIRAIIGFL
jgi:hypothetical protein